MSMDVEGRRRKMDGQCNLKSMDLREKGLPGEETQYRDARSETSTPHQGIS